MTATNPNLRDTIFKIYDTVGLENPEAVLHQLCGIQGDDTFEIESSTGKTGQEIIRHHRASVRPEDQYYADLFLIVDRPKILEQGVLIVNLKPYHGYADAVRHAAEPAGDAIGSLSIENSSWFDEREAWGEDKTDLVPSNWFALYDMLPSEQRPSFNTALESMNNGVGMLGLEEGEPSECYTGPQRNYHLAAKTDGKGLDQIIAGHVQYAKAHSLDPTMFAVIEDTEWKEKGALIVKVMPQEADTFRRKGPAAGEMLNWIFIGMMTWEEAKNWDGGPAALS